MSACLKGFNEAAGFTQRKHKNFIVNSKTMFCFNEAAGFTQRKHKMEEKLLMLFIFCFNEAAGFTQRKRLTSAA